MAKASRKSAMQRNLFAEEGAGTLSIRFDAKLRYQIELAARLKNKNLSNFIEECVREILKTSPLFPQHLFPRGDQTVTINNYIEELWDIDLPDRIAKLGIKAPHLLNHEEQKIWKLITQTSWLWIGKTNEFGLPERTDIQSNFDYQTLRKCWKKIVNIAMGELDASALVNPKAKKLIENAI